MCRPHQRHHWMTVDLPWTWRAWTYLRLRPHLVLETPADLPLWWMRSLMIRCLHLLHFLYDHNLDLGWLMRPSLVKSLHDHRQSELRHMCQLWTRAWSHYMNLQVPMTNSDFNDYNMSAARRCSCRTDLEHIAHAHDIELSLMLLLQPLLLQVLNLLNPLRRLRVSLRFSMSTTSRVMTCLMDGMWTPMEPLSSRMCCMTFGKSERAV